jgi:hypothetical protein
LLFGIFGYYGIYENFGNYGYYDNYGYLLHLKPHQTFVWKIWTKTLKERKGRKTDNVEW